MFSLIPKKLVRKNDGGGESRGHVQVASADSCRMKGIKDVGMVEQLFVADCC